MELNRTLALSHERRLGEKEDLKKLLHLKICRPLLKRGPERRKNLRSRRQVNRKRRTNPNVFQS